MSRGVSGRLYRATGSRSYSAELTAEGSGFLQLHGAGGEILTVAVEDAGYTAGVGGSPGFLTFPDGGRFEAEGDALHACWLAAGGAAEAESWLARLEGRTRYALLAVLATLLGFWLVYSFVVPRLAEQVVRRVPATLVYSIDQATLEGLEQRVFSASEVAPPQQAALRERLAPMLETASPALRTQLLFRCGPEGMGANAFTLPGGTIVLTDLLVENLPDDELEAVVAHELVHAEARHGLRQALQLSTLAVLWSWVTGDLGAFFSLVPVALLELAYARDFELEADAGAAQRLQALGADPRALARALTRLKALRGGAEGPAYLSTHPATDDRLQALEAVLAR